MNGAVVLRQGAARPVAPPVARVALAGTAVAIGVVSAVATVTAITGQHVPPGGDFGIYHEAARRWVSGEGFYYAHQLAGPYEVAGGDILYPPAALAVFVPFLILPAVLWWAIPLGVIAWMVAALRPAPWTWPLLALCAANPWSVELVYNGNPTMWIAAAVALSIRWPAASALVLLKPSLLPIALIGARHRSWWLTVAVMGGVSLLLLPLTLEWLRVVIDGRGPHSGVLYSVTHLPFAVVALVAWAGRSRAIGATRPVEPPVPTAPLP